MMVPMRHDHDEPKGMRDFIVPRSLLSPFAQDIGFGEVEQFCHNGIEFCS